MPTKQYENFEAFLGEQPDEVKALYETHLTGMKNTISATRKERDTFAKEIKELSKQAENGSELQKQLAEVSDKLTKTEKRAKFIEDAGSKGCLRPTIAYSVAISENLFDENGEPDWKRLQTSVPEIFKVANTKSNAGAGTKNVTATEDPNDAFRAATKR